MENVHWLTRGGWVDVNDQMPPIGRIVEVCQYVRDDVEAAPDLMSFQLCTHPNGNWHWEPDGHVSSVEPSHWRPLPAAVAVSRVTARATA